MKVAGVQFTHLGIYFYKSVCHIKLDASMKKVDTEEFFEDKQVNSITLKNFRFLDSKLDRGKKRQNRSNNASMDA